MVTVTGILLLATAGFIATPVILGKAFGPGLLTAKGGLIALAVWGAEYLAIAALDNILAILYVTPCQRSAACCASNKELTDLCQLPYFPGCGCGRCGSTLDAGSLCFRYVGSGRYEYRKTESEPE